MDGDWETIKSKPKANKKKTTNEVKVQYGGKSTKGTLTAGPIKQVGQNKQTDYSEMNNQASNIADFDYHVDDEYYDQETKMETVSHTCAMSIQTARLAKNMTQDQLAKAAKERLAVIKDYEAGTGQYNGATINNIEKVLGVKI